MKIYFVNGQIVNEYSASEKCVIDIDCNKYSEHETNDKIECWEVEQSDNWVSHTSFPALREYMNDIPEDITDLEAGAVFIAQEELSCIITMNDLAQYNASDMQHRYFYRIKEIINNVTFDELAKEL